MKNFYSCLIVFFLCVFTSRAQHFTFYPDNSLPFISGQNPIPYPFAGGLNAPSFNAVDLDADGRKDLVIFDRSGNRILTFINTGGPGFYSYVYAPQYEDAFPFVSRWMIMADYDGDGREDIFASRDGIYATVFKNTSNGNKPSFALVADTLFAYSNFFGSFNVDGVIVPNNDLPAITDIDGDGDLDIITTGPFGNLAALYQNRSIENYGRKDTFAFKFVDHCWGSFMFRAESELADLAYDCFSPRTYTSRASDPGYAYCVLDLDKDADPDLILAHKSSRRLAAYYNGKKDLQYPTDTMIVMDTMFPNQPQRTNLYECPAAHYIDVTNDGKRDLIVATNSAVGKTLNQIWFYKNEREDNWPDFNLVKKNFIQEDMLDLGSGGAPFFMDVNGDGKLDLLVANRGDKELTQDSADRIALFLNVSPKADSFVFKLTDSNYLNFIAYKIFDMKPAIGDMNGDGKPDMIVGQGNGMLRYFENTGTASAPAFTQISTNYKNIDVGSSAAPQIIDLDRDGLNDLVIGCQKGNILFFKNWGTKQQADFSDTPEIDSLGKIRVNAIEYIDPIYDDSLGIDTVGWDTLYAFTGYSTPHIADLDGDSAYDLVVGSEQGVVFMYHNIEKDLYGHYRAEDSFRYSFFYGRFGGADLGGRIVPTSFQRSKGKKRDLLFGNFGGGLQYMKGDTGAGGNSGINKIVPANFSLYPNPSSDQINLRLEDAGDRISWLIVYNLLGEKVLEIRNENQAYLLKVSLHDLVPGMYLVQLHTREGRAGTRKLVKKPD